MAFQWTYLPTHPTFQYISPVVPLTAWVHDSAPFQKVSIWQKKAAFHTKTTQSYIYVSDSPSCFNWDLQVVDAGAARVLWLCAATLQGWGCLHSESCNPPPARDDSEPKNKKGPWSRSVEQPFCFRFVGTEMGEQANAALPEDSSPLSTWPQAPLTFILFNSHF